MEHLINELLNILRPALKSATKADHILRDYWADKIALLWSTEDVHRAANENKTVLTETQARELLTQLNNRYNPQNGLRWSDLPEAIEQSGLGRDIKSRELHRFIHHDEPTIDPPIKPRRKKGSS